MDTVEESKLPSIVFEDDQADLVLIIPATEEPSEVGELVFDERIPIEYVSLDTWAHAIDRINEAKGWNTDDRSESEWAALAHSEISEAYEEYRSGHAPDEIYGYFEVKGQPYSAISGPVDFLSPAEVKPEGMAIEYADTLYRILHWFARHKISPSHAIALKMRYNLTRPYRHGGKVT